MTIDWAALGLVFLVSFGAAVGVIVLFALGISALAGPNSAPSQTAPKVTRRPWAWPVAMLCLGVRYGSCPCVDLAQPDDGVSVLSMVVMSPGSAG